MSAVTRLDKTLAGGTSTRLADALRLATGPHEFRVFPVHSCLPGQPSRCSCGNILCTSVGKHPRTHNGVRDATTDTDKIMSWWKEWPDANIAIACGLSNVVVLDFDTTKPDFDGQKLLDRLRREVPTLEVRSGSGGVHLYFRQPNQHLGCANQGMPRGVDVRGDGGYVLAPRSNHKSGGMYEVVADLPIQELPADIEEILRVAGRASSAEFKFHLPIPVNLDDLQIGEDIRAEIETAYEKGAADRSEVDFRICKELYKAGCNPDEIHWVFQHYGCGVDGKYSEGTRNSAEAYLVGTIWAAIEDVNHDRANEGFEVIVNYVKKTAEGASTFSTNGNGPAIPGVPTPPKPPKIEARTELGNSLRFVTQHGEEVRYVDDWKSWLIWNGKSWARDKTREAERRMKKTVNSINKEIPLAKDAEIQKELRAWAKRSESATVIRQSLELAKSDLIATPEMFDQDPYVLNCENGILDLRTGELSPHDPMKLCSRLAVPYDPSCPIPLWESYLDRFLQGDHELVDFLQESGGYTLTGRTTEKFFWVLNGPSGDNGKSTFITALREILGEYATSIKIDVVTSSYGRGGGDTATPSLKEIRNMRFVTSSEIPENWKPEVWLLKNFTGGEKDPINVRGLYETSSIYMPTQKLWFFGNPPPKLPTEDNGIWNRALLIPFKYTIPKEEIDADFSDKLRAEYPGILAWFVEGTQRWLKKGRLSPPQVVRLATEELREEGDSFLEFFGEEIDKGPYENGFAVSSENLLEAWLSWKVKRRAPSTISTKKAVNQKMASLGYESVHNSAGYKEYRGVKLRHGAKPGYFNMDLSTHGG